MNIKKYATELIKANGIDVAVKIAQRCKMGSSPFSESNLPNPPKGPNLFFPASIKNGVKKALKARLSNYQFWAHVEGILLKIGKGRS